MTSQPSKKIRSMTSRSTSTDMTQDSVTQTTVATSSTAQDILARNAIAMTKKNYLFMIYYKNVNMSVDLQSKK